jgi:C4-dicarboxylate-specific signal transduction histidine kinase
MASTGTFRPLMLWFCIIAGCIYAWVAWATFSSISSTHDAALREAKLRAQYSRLLFQKHIDRIFKNLDLLSQAAGNAYLNLRHNPELLRAELAKLNKRESFSLQLSVVRTDGIFVASSVSAKGGVDLRDREHIKAHFAEGGPSLFVSKPLVGRVSKRRSINVTRRFFDGQGKWAGITVVSFDLTKLSSFFEKAEIGNRGIITLLRLDGTLLARSTVIETAIGANFSKARPFVDFVARGVTEGEISTISPVDGQERLIQFSRVGNFPLLVLVGISQEESISHLRPTVWLASGWMILLGFLLVSSGLILKKFISNQVEAERAQMLAIKSEQTANLLQSAFLSTGVSVLIFDSEREINFANETVIKLLKVKPASQASQLSWLLGEFEPAPGQEVRHTTSRIQCEGGGHRSYIWTIAPADWVSQNSYIAIGFDRTEIEESESALYQKARLATLGEMSTGLAHEMAQPLTVVNFAASMIARATHGESKVKESVDLLQTAVERIKGTIDRMKIFARRDASAEFSVFDVNDAVNSVLVLTKNELALSNINLSAECNGDQLLVDGDEILFGQVLLNIILNARDAIVEKSLSDLNSERGIRINCGRDASHVVIRIADSGTGVSDELRDRIFEPFFTTKEKGTGLGLALSYGIITDMDGTMKVLSSVIGAEFEIRLPEHCPPQLLQTLAEAEA